MLAATILLRDARRRSNLILKSAAAPSSTVDARHFSITSAAASSNQRRIALALYRQILRFCDDIDEDIPLSTIVPPVSIDSPGIDANTLFDLAEASQGGILSSKYSRILDMFPEKTVIQRNRLIVPIHDVTGIRGCIRAVYRLNAAPAAAPAAQEEDDDDEETISEHQKLRISAAFDSLKSLNELSRPLEALKQERVQHMNRENVHYHVGQVVRHKLERWRGVVIGWQRPDENTNVTAGGDDKPQRTSLTTKDYTDPISHVEYTILMDSGDLLLLSGGGGQGMRRSRHNFGSTVAVQAELVAETDERLCRIRNNRISEHFERYDVQSFSFVANKALSYRYPSDGVAAAAAADNVSEDESTFLSITTKSITVSGHVVSGVQDFATHLIRLIGDKLSHAEGPQFKLLSSFQDKLSSMATGDVMSLEDRLSKGQLTPTSLASSHLRYLLKVTLELYELMWRRQLLADDLCRIKFSLGDIVYHKHFNFRGVVVGWDPKPTMDVTNWDGLQHIDNPADLPFYFVIPDQNDCIEAFGSERPTRYVCEDNLELCPIDRAAAVGVDLDWERAGTLGSYIPPLEAKFRFGEDICDGGLSEGCFNDIQDQIAQLFVASRDCSNSEHVEAVGNKLSFSNLFDMLSVADSEDIAVVIEEILKEMWKAHRSRDMRRRLEDGIVDLLRGEQQAALDTFKEIVAEDDTYAEAWNKIATCEYMKGNMDASLQAIKKVIKLQPRHLQALNGMGLVYFEANNYGLALKSFTRSLDLDPWSIASSRYSSCLDMLLNSQKDNKGTEAEDNRL